jgi:hypothetical protein
MKTIIADLWSQPGRKIRATDEAGCGCDGFDSCSCEQNAITPESAGLDQTYNATQPCSGLAGAKAHCRFPAAYLRKNLMLVTNQEVV